MNQTNNGFATSYSLTGSSFKERAKVMPIQKGPSATTCSHNYIRIAPPMLQQATNGSWRVWHNIHFGYEAPGKDPGKLTPRTFVCPRKEEKGADGWREVVGCDECKKNAWMDQQRKMAEADVHAQANAAMQAGQQVTEQQVKDAVQARCKPFNDYLKRHNLQRGYWVNGWSPELGGPVRTRLNAKACNALIERLEDYRRRGVDGLALDQGLLFDIRRYGNGFGKEDEVHVVMEQQTINGQVFDVPKRFPLTPEMQQRLLDECQDLGDASPAVVLSPEQVAELVKMGDQDPEAVDRFFKRVYTDRRGDGGSAPRAVPTNPLIPAGPVTSERIPAPPALPPQTFPPSVPTLGQPPAASYQANPFVAPVGQPTNPFQTTGAQVTMGTPQPPSFIQGDQNAFARGVAAPTFRPGNPQGEPVPDFAPSAGFGSTQPAGPAPAPKWTAEELMRRLNLPGSNPAPAAQTTTEAVEQLLKTGQ